MELTEQLELMGFSWKYEPSIWVGVGELIPDLRDLDKAWSLIGDSILLGLGFKYLSGCSPEKQWEIGSFVRREINMLTLFDSLDAKPHYNKCLQYSATLATLALLEQPGLKLFNAIGKWADSQEGGFDRE